MKKFLCFLLLLYANNILAQDTTRILIKADQIISDVLTPEKIYQYPKFSRGKIVFRDKATTEALLNYNYLNGEIEFINPGNDTLAIAEWQLPNIRRIELNKDTFYYDDGYVQQVVQTSLGKLAKRKMLVVLKKEKIGAYGQPTSTINVEALTSYRDNYRELTSIKVRENITMVYRDEFFFGDNYFHFLPANKKNLLKIYGPRKAMINEYLKENQVNFGNSDQLQKLFVSLK